MLKPLTLSLSLAFALGATSVSMAGHHGGTTYASGQCAAPSSQCAAPSAQCGTTCAPKKQCCLTNLCNKMKKACTPKPKCYTYTWVLKKKRVWGCHGGGNACGSPACETCGVYPSGQGYAAPSGQGYAAPAGQTAYSMPSYGTGMAGGLTPAPAAPAIATAPAGDEAPPAPEVPSATGPQSSLLFSTTPAGN